MQLILGISVITVLLYGYVVQIVKFPLTRRKHVLGLFSLALVLALGVSLLTHFENEPWSNGVATGLFAVVVFDSVRLTLSTLFAANAKESQPQSRV